MIYVFKCNTCKKPTPFVHMVEYDSGEEVIVVECQRCLKTGVRVRIEALDDKKVVRCQQCGAWKMEAENCYTKCKKTNVPSV